jgi:hypothetical protein
MKKLLLAILITISVSAGAEELIPPPEVSALADIGTTALALGRGATELNPLGFVGSTVAKGAYFVFRDDLTNQDRELADRVLTSAWTGAAVNNLIIFTGGLTAVALPIGALVGVALYVYNTSTLEELANK